MKRKKKVNKNYLDEDEIINNFLQKLNLNKSNVFNFLNDGAIIHNKTDKEIVVSQDTLIEKIHFFSNDTAKSIASKSLRVNLSDLASMGAKPYAYTMSLSLKKSTSSNWLKEFSNCLFNEQKKYGLYLLGGDIVRSKYLSISITIFGLTNKNVYVTRNGAKINDDLWVTGNIGDAYIGYKILNKQLNIKDKGTKNYFLKKYHFPNPPIKISYKLNKIMTSAIDISDGFYGDLEKITTKFMKGAKIDINKIPFSNKSKTLLRKKIISISNLLAGGDDYQLIFTSNPSNRYKIYRIFKINGLKITRIGSINKSKKLNFVGNNLKILKKSYIHKI